MFSDNSIVFDVYASNTALLVGSGLCYKMVDAGLQVCFKEDDDIVVDLIDPKPRSQGDWGKSYLPQLGEGPWVLSGIRRLLFLGLSPSWTIDEEEVTPEGDAHSFITQVAYHLPDGGCGLFGQEEADFVTRIRREVGYRDYPPIRTANYVSLLASQFRGAELNEWHAVRPTVRDQATGGVKLQGMPETRLRIRRKMEEHLDEVHRITEALAQNPPVLSEEGKLRELLAKLTKMKEALAANRLPEVVQGIKDLRSLFRYAQSSDIVFPNGDSNQYANKEVLEILMRDYNDVAQEIRLALADFERAKKGDTKALASGTVHYKNFLRYLREESWNGLASGRGPLQALKELRLAAALHLGQDSVAHCRQWEKKREDVCQEIVSVNLFGWGTLHNKDDDRIKTEEGDWKPASQWAIAISFQIRKLSHTTRDAFEERKKAFLDRFWPVD